MRKILGIFEVFLGVFEKTKEKKDRVWIALKIHIRRASGEVRGNSGKSWGFPEARGSLTPSR